MLRSFISSGAAGLAVATAAAGGSSSNVCHAEARAPTMSKSSAMQAGKIDDDWIHVLDNITEQEIQDAYKTTFDLSQTHTREFQLEIPPENRDSSDSEVDDYVLGHSTEVMEAAEQRMTPADDPLDMKNEAFYRMVKAAIYDPNVQKAFLQNPEVRSVWEKCYSPALGFEASLPALPAKLELLEEAPPVVTPREKTGRPRTSRPGVHFEGSLEDAFCKMSSILLKVRKQAQGVLEGMVRTMQSLMRGGTPRRSPSAENIVEVELLAVDGEDIRVHLGPKQQKRDAQDLDSVMQKTMAMVVLVLAVVLFRRVGLIRKL